MTDPAPRIAAKHLSKVFDLQKRRRGRTGISSRELAALGQLGRSVMRLGVKDARRFYALSDISFEVAPGEIMGIIGRNGAGKSTMLKILARVLDPSDGAIVLNGRVASLLELGAGFSGDLSVSENISLHVALSGGKDDPELEERILELAELTDYRDVDLDDCPGSAMARLSFATLISLNSDIVLADEMLAAGDARFKEMVLNRIQGVRSDGGAVLFVSHDLRAIAEICDRVMWIDRGRNRMLGAARDVIEAYEAELHAQTSALDPSGGAAARIVELRLVDADGHQIGAVALDRACHVECIFQHLRPDVPLGLSLELIQGKRRTVFVVDAELTPIADRPRAFRARLPLPAHFLSDGNYEACVTLHWTSEGEPRQDVSMKTGFRAIDNSSQAPAGDALLSEQAGLVAPRLRWRVARARAPKTAEPAEQ